MVDIPDITFGNFYYTHWPVFNIADSCVTCGVILLMFFNSYIPTFDEIKSGIPNTKETQDNTQVVLDRDELQD